MNMIVAVDENWAIGNKGSLLVRIPADHKNFRNETIGKVVVKPPPIIIFLQVRSRKKIIPEQ